MSQDDRTDGEGSPCWHLSGTVPAAPDCHRHQGADRNRPLRTKSKEQSPVTMTTKMPSSGLGTPSGRVASIKTWAEEDEFLSRQIHLRPNRILVWKHVGKLLEM